jgi:hypothetical protein
MVMDHSQVHSSAHYAPALCTHRSAGSTAAKGECSLHTYNAWAAGMVVAGVGSGVEL